jgi:hypothetical protein
MELSLLSMSTPRPWSTIRRTWRSTINCSVEQVRQLGGVGGDAPYFVAREQWNGRRAGSGSMKDPLLLMVSVAIVCIVGVLVYGTVVTIHERTITALQNRQTDVVQHR